MAPKKQPSNEEQLVTTRSATLAAGRVTRSQSKGGKEKLRAPVLASPKKKKAKTAAPKKKKTEDVAEPEVEKQPETTAEEKEQENAPENGEVKNDGKDEAQGTDAALGKKTIVVEHCKQCKSFKVRADQVKLGLEKAIPGIVVELNPEKPRRGCFEVREEGGEVFISLENMPRPFKKMKDLDMDEVVADIVGKIK